MQTEPLIRQSNEVRPQPDAHAVELRRLWKVKLVCRLALGMVWIIEGIVPKILFVSAGEIELVRKSQLYWPTPEGMLILIGVAEIVAGVWLLTGIAERVAVAAVTLAMSALVLVVVITDVTMLANPLGGISKNLCLLACALVVWRLAPLVPNKEPIETVG